MSYSGGVEDPQNWPFSVRYTASPYRKSKFPLDGTVKTGTAAAPTRDMAVSPSVGVDPLSSNNLIPSQQQQQHSHHHQFLPHQFQTQPPPHWLPSTNETNADNTVTSAQSIAYRGQVVQNGVSSLINSSGGVISRSTNVSTTTSSSSASKQIGALHPLHQVVPHHQANQPLFAQALVNYHNTQSNSSSSACGSASNFRHHLHNQRQLQFQKGGAAGGRLGGLLGTNNLSAESSHFHPNYQQYQNQERQGILQLHQQKLLMNTGVSSSAGSPHLHPFLSNGPNNSLAQNSIIPSSVGVKSSVHPDHHHYGLPISSGGGANAGNLSHASQQQPVGLLGAQILSRSGNNSGSQHLRQGNAVWHLLTENKDLDQVEGLDEGYIEDLKQPFLFHQSGTSTAAGGNLPTSHHSHQQQINSIIKSGGGVAGDVLNFHQQHQQTNSSFIPNPQQHFQGATSVDFQNPHRRNDHLPMVYPPGTISSQHHRGNTNLDYDPYSYVYDSHIQDDHLLMRNSSNGGNVNSFVGDRSDLVGFNGLEFPNKAALSNTSSLQGLPPSFRSGFGGPCTSTTNGGNSDEDVSENEYEEIQDVARYMNSASLYDSNHPDNLLSNSSSAIVSNTKEGSVNSSSSPDANYEYDSVHPNYDDIGLSNSGHNSNNNIDSITSSVSANRVEEEAGSSTENAGGNNEVVSSSGASSSTSNNNSQRSPALGPPRHFKSFSSTDDILAEVVQVQQKHDRVLDQLNLEVENLLIRSTKQEIEQNELNCQRSQQQGNGVMLFRNGHHHHHSIHTHSHQQSGDHPHECSVGAKCYYCNSGSGSSGEVSGSGSGSCLKEEQMLTGTTTSSTENVMMNMNSNGITANNANASLLKGEGSNNEMDGSCNCCCCCGCCSSGGGDNNGLAVASSSSKDKAGTGWRENLKASLLSGFHNHAQYNHTQSHYHSVITSGKGKSETKVINSTSVACISALGATNSGTISRKKKLDRNAPGQLSDTNLRHKLNTLSAIQNHNEQFQKSLKEKQQLQTSSTSCTSLCMDLECASSGTKVGNNMNVLNTLHHHHHNHLLQDNGLLARGGKGGWKGGRYHRSHSLIPNWKIRDHLMRLPFLRQHKDKLKKGDGGSSCSSLHTSAAATTGSGGVSTNNTNGGGTAIPKSISGVDFSPNASSLSQLGVYNRNQCNNPLLHLNNGNHAGSSCILAHHHHKNMNGSNGGTSCASTAATTTCSFGGAAGGVNNIVAGNNNPSIKLVRSSSMDELRPTEEHWYSADSDTEPDSLTAIIPPPQSAASSSNNIDNCCGRSNNNANGNPSSCDGSSSVVAGADVSKVAVTVIDQGQKCASGNSGCCCTSGNGDSCCGGGGNHPTSNKLINGGSHNVVGNIYTNSPNGGSSGSCVTSINNACGGGGGSVGFGSTTENGTRMDVVSSTIIPEAPKAPKFRRGTQGLKDKWRESWSHSKTLSKNNMDEDNRLLRWFSLRKNSATLDSSSVSNSNHSNRHSTLPQLTEEDLKRISFMEDEEGYWPRRTVQPPSLPPPPPDLSSDQITRRHIIAAIVHSENSYVAALQRLVNEYKKPLECSHPAMLSHSKISSIFHRVPEILQCHSLFRIALAECVRRWDTEEKIGDVFVASFSKSLVLDVYSEFINNFGTAMETAKLEARRKSAFAEFLKVKQMTAHDRLSLFGLMVKPVQRFPQFILLLQDLLKHTPRDHHDRMSLQLALTQLESLAAMLNERKRESEQYQAFKETIKSIGGGKFVLLRNAMDDPNRILLRQDVVTQLEFDSNGGTVAKSKCRKLLLLNDMLICTTLPNTSSSSLSGDHNLLNRKNSSGTLIAGSSNSEEHSANGNNGSKINNGSATSSINHTSSGKAEKCMFKWSYPVREVEVEDISISPTMSRFVQNTSTANKGSKTSPEDTASIILLEEMQCLMHDYEVLSRILTLVQSLKSSYDGLTEASVKELMLEIQNQIQRRDEQISYFDSSCLTLLLGSGNNKEKVIFQMQSPQARNEWIEELRLAQLALDPSNSPAWDIPLESPYPLHKLPLFVKATPVCKSPLLTVVKCGCYFTHTTVSQTGRSKIFDYLWVSSTDGMSSHLTSFRSQQNALKEVSSFDLVEEKVNDLLFVLGHIWMGTESRKIMVYDPSDPDKGSIGHYLLSDSVVKMTFYNSTIYAGLADGNLAVFTELSAPAKSLRPEIVVKLGAERITSIFGSKDSIFAACGNAVVTVDAKTHTVERNVVLTHHNGPISHMACSGVGLWIATHESGTVCLYHLESLQHLQDVSIAPSVYRTVRDSFRRQKGVHVTCLMAHKGWLWIGTNLGVILTIPLPRLEGVPIISTGNANVSFHGFVGPVSFLMPLMKPPPMLLPLQQKNHNKYNNHQKEFKETNVEVKDDSYIEMSSPMSPPPLPTSSMPDSSSKSPQPVVLQSDELSSGELCLNISNSSSNQGEKVNSVSFSSHNEVSINNNAGGNSKDSSDKDEYVNAVNNNLNSSNISEENEEEDGKHDSLSSVPSAECSSSSFNQIGSSQIDGGGGGGGSTGGSSCNSMERGVTPVSSASSPSTSISNSKTLVVLRKKSSKDNVFLRNCKTLPRGGPIPSRFSIESDVYGLYGNLINVRGLEDEGRFVDPLYDALRRSDPELNALDAKISTLDRRLKMRMSRPRSLDLSNWSVDSKMSASSDESVGLGSRSSQQTTDSNNAPSQNLRGNSHSPMPLNQEIGDGTNNAASTDGKDRCSAAVGANGGINNSTGTTNKKTMSRQKHKSVKGSQERTVLVVVGGRGYLNMRTQPHPDQFLSSNMESEAKSCTHLTLWQMKT